jgi:hypothetical protein
VRGCRYAVGEAQASKRSKSNRDAGWILTYHRELKIIHTNGPRGYTFSVTQFPVPQSIYGR